MTPDRDQPADRNTHEDFRTCLTIQARRRYERTPATYLLVLAAVANGWRPHDLAKACSRNLPTAPLAAAQQINRVLAWAGENKPPQAGAGLAVKQRRHVCNHTEDPNGWLMDDQGEITGKCRCWTEVRT